MTFAVREDLSVGIDYDLLDEIWTYNSDDLNEETIPQIIHDQCTSPMEILRNATLEIPDNCEIKERCTRQVLTVSFVLHGNYSNLHYICK